MKKEISEKDAQNRAKSYLRQHGLRYKDIAEAHNVTESAVKKALNEPGRMTTWLADISGVNIVRTRLFYIDEE